MRVAIASVAIGPHWYHRGIARLINEFTAVSPMVSGGNVEFRSWINNGSNGLACLPPGCPTEAIDDGVDYLGYVAKPFAFKALKDSGVDIGLLLDASFVPIKNIQPLIDFVDAHGYYMAPSGFRVGEWMSDRMLAGFGLDREEILKWEECQSGCVCIDFRRPAGRAIVDAWAATWPFFAGHHSNRMAGDKRHHYKNVGFVSTDSRVQGHRHDQSALSVVAHSNGFGDYFKLPRFSAHAGGENNDTVLVCRGPE